MRMVMIIAALAAAGLLSARSPNTDENAVLGIGDADMRAWRERWLMLTAGENVAYGKRAVFSIAPNYALTTDDNDAADLTDGVLAMRAKEKDDRIWFSKNAVGWMNVNSVNIMIDLGDAVPLERVVVRTIAGREQGSLVAPSLVAVYVSSDGKTFYERAVVQKLLEGDGVSGAQEGVYSVREEGRAFVYPFAVTNLGVKARYLGLRIVPDRQFLFIDEIEVIRDAAPQRPMDLPKRPFFIRGMSFAPLKTELVLAQTPVPSFLSFNDMRTAAEQKRTPNFVAELPAGITLARTASAGTVREEAIQKNGMPYIRWTFQKPRVVWNTQIGPLFFTCTGTLPDAKAEFYAYDSESADVNRTEVPLRSAAMPEGARFKRFHASIGWGFSDTQIRDWPDCFTHYAKAGLNAVALFPHFWNTPAKADEGIKLIREAREKGFGIVHVDSPFHRMIQAHEKDPDVYSAIPGKTSRNACPSYRGPFYAEEMQRIEKQLALSKPDSMFLDIELWREGALDAEKCSRCREYMQQKGLSGKPFLHALGRELGEDIRAAVTRAAKSGGFSAPNIGLYNIHSDTTNYHEVYSFEKLYPVSIDITQPSLYVKGDAKLIRERVRADYAVLKKRASIPWLSTGTYGEYDSARIEPMILETIMNGASGYTFFKYEDFDTVLDWYYHARAVALIAPYEEMLWGGGPIELKSANDALSVSAWRSGKEMLVLAANYTSKNAEHCELAIPPAEITDVRTGKRIAKASFDLGYYQFALVHATLK